MSDREIRLDLEEASAPAWQATLVANLRAAPEPEAAARRATQVLECLDEPTLAALILHPRSLARCLSVLCGNAPFFAAFLTRHPALLLDLVLDDLREARRREQLAASLSAALASLPKGDPAVEVALRQFKYRELARITVRDCVEELVPLADSEVTLRELSHLADALLAASLATAQVRIAERFGKACWPDADGSDRTLGFCVLGLGKLGAEELNYSSDVDLIYVHEAAPPDLRPAADQLAPNDYFSRVAREFGTIVADSSSEGFLYRVDLDLRPEGSRGALVVSNENLAAYYEGSAHGWEMAAFTKARPVAGDLSLGWRSIRTLDPMIYRSGMNYAGVEAIRSLKQKVEESRARPGGAFDVKIGAGGIRDVEFVAQALQLLHGGRIPQIRERSTPASLRSLAAVGLLESAAQSELLQSYLFLRRVENRLQMVAERQTHSLPTGDAALEQLARSLGFSGDDARSHFEATLEERRRQVRELLGASLSELSTERILELFARNLPSLLSHPSARQMVEELADRFARAIQECPHPERATDNLDRFLHGVGQRRFYYELLLDRPELVGRLTALFSSSNYLSSYFSVHPRLIEPVFAEPDRLLLTEAELQSDFDQILAEAQSPGDGGDPSEARLKALRLFHHRQVINVGLLDVGRKIGRSEATGALTQIAEVCLQRAVEGARERLAGRAQKLAPRVRDAAFLVVGMGKLATHELSYGSDLDVVFLHDAEGELEAQDHFARLAQRLISALQVPTAEGRCYEIDARLRPSGNQGTLVTSISGFRRYHAQGSQNWERQALLRARPVAGDAALATDFEAARLEVLYRPPPDDLATEIHRIRQRMETELARETSSKHDFKTGRGGVLDIESIVDYTRLLNAPEHPELLAVDRIEVQIERLAELDLLSRQDQEVLLEGWHFLQNLGSSLRIVENRSISDLDEERGDLDGVALRLGYGSAGRAGARRELLRDYRRHTGAIRDVYCRTLGVDDSSRGGRSEPQ